MLDSAAQRLLNEGLSALPFAVSDAQEAAFVNYLTLLNQWNQVHNLTAIRNPREQVIAHVLDCLSIVPFLPDNIRQLADIGSGAGLPAFMLAMMLPDVQVYAVEVQRKKVAFMRHAAVQLGLHNVTVVDKRVENWQPEQPLDVVVSRAMASVNTLLTLSAHLGGKKTLWLLMRARESEKVQHQGFEQGKIQQVDVPFLEAKRHILMVNRTGSAL